jgi:hypothetical protein
MALAPLDPTVAFEVLLAAAGVALWFALFAGALLLTRPADVQPVPPTQDFGGDEPPAVVSLVANRWELTEDGAESTFVDLAARRIIELRQPANDPMQTTVHIREPNPSGLNGYEQMIFSRVAGLAVGGVVPLTALTFRDPAEAKSWSKRINAAIVADARSRGVSQRRFSPTMVSALTILAAIPAFAVGGAVALNVARENKLSDDWGAIVGAGLVVWFLLGGFAGRSRGERDTARGREVAARWLGLKSYLRNDESFADLPPSAVAVWDRYLSYGDAVGATRVCSAVIDLGMGNRKRVWSSFGGRWHRVRVRYPKLWRRYGLQPTGLVVKAVLALVAAFLVFRYSAVPADVLPGRFTAQFDLVATLAFLVFLAYGMYTLVATIVDLATPVTVTGEVLWLEVWRQKSGGEDRPPVPWLHYLALDDGRDDRTVAWGCPSDLVPGLSCGDIVTLTVRRWTRRVTAVKLDQRGQQRALEVAAASGSSDDTENLVLSAMGVVGARGAQAVASALRTPTVAPAQLLTADEVSRALGVPVTAAGHSGAALGPMAMESYQTTAGKRVLFASVATGPAADLAMRMRRRYQAVPGIGDEAYAGEHWAIGRRGSNVLMLQLHGPGRQTDPRNVYWLLQTAVARMPAG